MKIRAGRVDRLVVIALVLGAACAWMALVLMFSPLSTDPSILAKEREAAVALQVELDAANAVALRTAEKLGQSESKNADILARIQQSDARASEATQLADTRLIELEKLRQAEILNESRDLATAMQSKIQAEQSAATVAALEAELTYLRNGAARVREFMQGAFHSFAPASVGRTDARVLDVMTSALVELEAGGLDDDPESKAQLQSTIATILMNGGQSVLARPIFDEVLLYRRKLHTTDHADLADAIGDASTVRILLGDLAGAETLAQDSLAMYRRLSPGDQLVVAASISNLALLERLQGKWADALRDSQESIDMLTRITPGNNWKTARELHQLAEIHDECSHWDDAARIHEKSLAMKLALTTDDHPDVAAGLTSLGGVLQSKGQLAQAEVVLTKALEMQSRLHPTDDPTVADATNNLASVLQALERSTEAERLFRQALSMKERIYKRDHASVASALTSLGFVEQSLGRNDLAVPLFVRALDMCQRLHSGDHSTTARALNCLAWIRFDMGDFSAAAESARASADMYERLVPGGDSNRAVAIALVGRITKKLAKNQGEIDSAIAMIAQAQSMVLAHEAPTGPNAKAVLALKDEIERSK